MDSARPNFLRPTNLGAASAQGFWEGLARGKLMANACRLCAARFFPPRALCPECLSDELDWVELSGRGTLHSWTVVHHAGPEFDTPFTLGLVDLEAGMGRIAAKVRCGAGQELSIGMPVRIGRFEATDGFTPYCVELAG